MWLAASGAAMMAAGVALRYATEADLEVPPPRSRRTAVQPRQSSSSGDAAGVAGASKAVDSPIHAVAAPSGPKPVTTESPGNAPAGGPAKQTGPPRPKRHLRVLYASQLGHAKLWAERLCDDVQKIVVPMLDREAAKRAASASAGDAVPELVLVGAGPEPCSNIEDADDLAFEDIVLFVVSTYEGGAPPPAAVPFFNSLSEVANDFRIHKALLANVRYAILGIGDSAYDEDRWCAAAKGLDMLMASLNARRLGDVGLADSGAGAVVDTVYKQWLPELVSELKQNLVERKSTAKPQGKAEADLPVESDDESDANDELQDLEDLAGPAKGKPEPELQPGESPGMVTPNLRAALTKQGYKIIGSHSGVKLCRWTKAQMRGRGGCYKHTFYGIQSHRCMEMTPSLACANKCVFCWRHHSNPVGREWRWKTDAPEMLINGAIDNHTQMIKSLKGVPGVKPERMAEGLEVKHCALSLVGEPIMYPFINQFVDMLHERKISSFMVSNAQFPEQMRNLHPVTQMYISVDASNKDNLKAIDRPIFADFWERFLDSIDALRENGQRTVFRMTLVHGWNDDKAAPSEEGDDAEDAAKALEAAPEKPSSDGRPLHKRVTSTKEQEEKGAQIIGEYAELAKRGEPGLIEIKGVTFCGTSGASSLTMKNVPFHEEVLDFSRRMCDHPALEGKYGVACVHQHSCCVLIAKKDPYFDEENKQWRTWIDFPKFQELVVAGNPFTAEDYMLPTPSWALDNSPEEGFDPNEQRFKRNRPYNGQGC